MVGAARNRTPNKELERRKLEAEVSELERPFFKKPTFWLSVATAIAAIYGIIFEYQRSVMRAERAALDLERAKAELQAARELKSATQRELADIQSQREAEAQKLDDIRVQVVETERSLKALRESIPAEYASQVNQALRSVSDVKQALDQVSVRVVDVGSGLCAVSSIPGDHYLVYDAGSWTSSECKEAVAEIVGDNEIDLMILSHSDADHLGDVEGILEQYAVKQIVWDGEERSTTIWRRTQAAILKEVQSGAKLVTSASDPSNPRITFTLGEAIVTIITGGLHFPQESISTQRNASSVVARLDYGDRSILFPGDIHGRNPGAPDDACELTEKFIVDHAAEASPAADVLIAPSHGSDFASSSCFIGAVRPTYVVFSTGHKFEAPSQKAVDRYLTLGIPEANMFRTDYGDDEGGNEATFGRIAGCADQSGDDDIDIVVGRDGSVDVRYHNIARGC